MINLAPMKIFPGGGGGEGAGQPKLDAGVRQRHVIIDNKFKVNYIEKPPKLNYVKMSVF